MSAAEKDRRFTTSKTLELCRRLAMVEAFDLDVAAEEGAARAPKWFRPPDPQQRETEWREGVDGLQQPWSGRVWCNPPFSALDLWVEKAWMEWTRAPVLYVPNLYRSCDATGNAVKPLHAPPSVIAMLVPANRCDQPWWHRLVEPYRDGRREHPLSVRTHFLPGRTRFGTPDDVEGLRAGSPPFGCVLLVWSK